MRPRGVFFTSQTLTNADVSGATENFGVEKRRRKRFSKLLNQIKFNVNEVCCYATEISEKSTFV